jgi:hypothetical protein
MCCTEPAFAFDVLTLSIRVGELGVRVHQKHSNRFRMVVHHREITKSAKKLLQSAAPGALVWITYPKKTSGVDSDLSRDGVWAATEGTGWRPVSQIAIDDVWSALRFRPTQEVKSRK